ncbi:MAG: rhomboid family intramembrane serine protease [Candidatus Pacearchaeota archaeon]
MVQYSFYPRGSVKIFPEVTLILIVLNIVLFFLFSILFKVGLSIDYVAIKPSNILKGDYLWTFFTSMFMHGNFIHLFVNMFSLLFIGNLVERIIGRVRYISFYLLSGFVASFIFVLFSLIPFPIFSSDFDQFAVGASGALFGLIGLLMLLTPNLPVFIMFIPIPIKMKYAGPSILVFLWLVSILSDLPIGNTAHFGGLLAGIVYGIYLRKRYRRKVEYLRRIF